MKTLVSLCTFGLPMPEEGWARLDAAWRSSRLNILSQKSESAFGEVQVRHETETARKQASQLCRVAGTSPGWRTRFACIVRQAPNALEDFPQLWLRSRQHSDLPIHWSQGAIGSMELHKGQQHGEQWLRLRHSTRPHSSAMEQFTT